MFPVPCRWSCLTIPLRPRQNLGSAVDRECVGWCWHGPDAAPNPIAFQLSSSYRFLHRCKSLGCTGANKTAISRVPAMRAPAGGYVQSAEPRDCSWVVDLDWGVGGESTHIVPTRLPHLRPTAETSLRARSKLTCNLARSSRSPGTSAPSRARLTALIIGSNLSIMIRRLRSA